MPLLGVMPFEFCIRNSDYRKSSGMIRWWTNFDDVFNRFDTVLACDQLTDKYSYSSIVFCVACDKITAVSIRYVTILLAEIAAFFHAKIAALREADRPR